MTDNDGSMAKVEAPRNKEELEKYFKAYKFTQKERKTLGECYDEAFYTRGLPLAFGLAIFIEFSIRSGHIKPHKTLGSLPKVLIGGTLGLFFGMLSARNVCYDKLRASPDSWYGRYLEHMKYGDYYFDYMPIKLRASNNEYAANTTDNSFLQPNSLNLDLERPDYRQLDAFQRFPNDDSMENTQYANEPKILVTYEQLRRKNRDTYTKTADYK